MHGFKCPICDVWCESSLEMGKHFDANHFWLYATRYVGGGLLVHCVCGAEFPWTSTPEMGLHLQERGKLCLMEAVLGGIDLHVEEAAL